MIKDSNIFSDHLNAIVGNLKGGGGGFTRDQTTHGSWKTGGTADTSDSY